jgi:hypothetical protein
MYVDLRTEVVYLYRHMKGYRLKCLGSISPYSISLQSAHKCCLLLLYYLSAFKGVFVPHSVLCVIATQKSAF